MMKAFDPNYKLLDEMYQDNYYPVFLVDKVRDELQKVIDLLESGETDTEVIQKTLDKAVCSTMIVPFSPSDRASTISSSVVSAETFESNVR